MGKQRSVIICGGGIVGLCTAYYLAREDFRVILLERNAEGADASAHGSAGFGHCAIPAAQAAPCLRESLERRKNIRALLPRGQGR